MGILCKILGHDFDWIDTSYIYRPKCPKCDVQLLDNRYDEGYIPGCHTVYIPPTKVWCTECGQEWTPDETKKFPHIDKKVTPCKRCEKTHIYKGRRHYEGSV